MAKQLPTKRPHSDGHTEAGTDLFFLGVEDVYGPEPKGQTFNLRDPRQVEERLKRRHARSPK